MKNILKLNIKACLILIFIVTACSDPLEEKPFSFISKANFYNSPEEAEAAIIGVYEQLYDVNRLNWWHCLNHSSDYATIHRNATFMEMDSWQLTAFHPFVDSAWEYFYKLINRSNSVIDNIPSIQMNELRKESILAEARLLRGFAYFHLVRMFGEVPLRISEINSLDDVHLEKSSIADIYNQIIDDLQFAEIILPEERPDNEIGRVNKHVAKTILADVYLTLNQWDKAENKAKEVIDSNLFSLQEDFSSIFSINNENNDEIIFSLQFDGVTRGNRLAAHSHNGGGINPWIGGAFSVWQVDEASDIWQKWDKNDLRRDYSVYDRFISINGDTVNVKDLARPYPAFSKYRANNSTPPSEAPIDYIFYRYAEILLIYAEALIRQDINHSEAYEAINKIRRRAYGQPINQVSTFDLEGLDNEVFLDSLIWERNKEFVLEQKRTYDLMRIGEFPDKLMEVGKNPKSAKLFPIPQNEIESNNALSVEDQNPGY